MCPTVRVIPSLTAELATSGGGRREGQLGGGCPPQRRGHCVPLSTKECGLSRGGPVRCTVQSARPPPLGEVKTNSRQPFCPGGNWTVIQEWSSPQFLGGGVENHCQTLYISWQGPLAKFAEVIPQIGLWRSTAFLAFGDSPVQYLLGGCARHLVLHTPLEGRPVTRTHSLPTKAENRLC